MNRRAKLIPRLRDGLRDDEQEENVQWFVEVVA